MRENYSLIYQNKKRVTIFEAAHICILIKKIDFYSDTENFVSFYIYCYIFYDFICGNQQIHHISIKKYKKTTTKYSIEYHINLYSHVQNIYIKIILICILIQQN